MPRLQLHNLVVPGSSLQDTSSVRQRRLEIQQLLDGQQAAVADMGADPEDLTLRGQFRGEHATKLGREVDELIGAPGYDAVAMFVSGRETDLDAYYELERTDSGRLNPNTDLVYRFDGTLKRRGTRGTHWRAVETSVTEVEHNFGNYAWAPVGLPSAARSVQWYDADTGRTQDASTAHDTTFESEFGRVDVFNAWSGDAPWENPTLLYELPYAHEAPTAVRTWDTRGSERKYDVSYSGATVGSATVGTDAVGRTRRVCRWGRVFDPSHEFEGTPVVENGLFRLIIDEARGHLRGYRYQADTGAYERVATNVDRLRITDVDLVQITPVSTVAHITYNLPNSIDKFVIRVELGRGHQRSLISRIDDSAYGLPQDFRERLDALAQPNVYSAGASRTLVSRSEVPE